MMKFNHYRNNYPEWRRFGHEESYKGNYSRHYRGGSREGYGGRGGGKRRFFERGEFKFALLELLDSAPMHGYQLIKAMEEKTGGLYSPSAGSVYPNLQLLEDMNLIGFSEEEGKKLYHITKEGKELLRNRRSADTERSDNLWKGRGRHRQSEQGGKHELRNLMKEWPDVILLLAHTANAVQEIPASKQANFFQSLMTKLESDLKGIMDTIPAESTTDPAAPVDTDQPKDDKPNK